MRFELKLKVCGMRDAANMREIAGLKPDFLGLIFYSASPRCVAARQLKDLPHFAGISRVGVFVNEGQENVWRIAETARLEFIQLHGDESPQFCRVIKRRNLIVIKAFAVDENFNGKTLKRYEDVCDYFLFDAKTRNRGGGGKPFDWRVLRRFEINRPFFLGGGVGAENAAEAIAACENLPLYALDVNSRAETAPGVKSPQIIKRIIETTRQFKQDRQDEQDIKTQI